jgi:hypothetical protein
MAGLEAAGMATSCLPLQRRGDPWSCSQTPRRPPPSSFSLAVFLFFPVSSQCTCKRRPGRLLPPPFRATPTSSEPAPSSASPPSSSPATESPRDAPELPIAPPLPRRRRAPLPPDSPPAALLRPTRPRRRAPGEQPHHPPPPHPSYPWSLAPPPVWPAGELCVQRAGPAQHEASLALTWTQVHQPVAVGQVTLG